MKTEHEDGNSIPSGNELLTSCLESSGTIPSSMSGHAGRILKLHHQLCEIPSISESLIPNPYGESSDL